MSDEAANNAADDLVTEAGSEENQVAPLNLSDEEFEKMGDSFLESLSPEEEAALEDDGENEDVDDDPQAGAEGEDGDDEDEGEGDEEDADDSDEDNEDDADDAEEEDSDSEDKEGDDESEDGDEGKEVDSDNESSKVDYKAEHEALLAPFRANGKDMQVNSVEDARKLMQMGANYNKKMGALKPGLAALKMLENNELLDPEKLNFLIDLSKGNKEAITQLLKDGKINPLELDLETEQDYKADDHSVNPAELDLDNVLSELRDSEHYNQTIDVVTVKWDSASKQTVASQPQLLRVIHDHMANGIYDKISTRVESERMFGRLDGLTDIQAYGKIGDAMEAAGEFANLSPAKEPGAESTDNQSDKDTRKSKNDTKRRAKRRAASSKRRAASSQGSSLDPLAMSDEEFAKQHDANLL